MPPPKEQITSTANPWVKRARRLRQKKHRDGEGAFLVEGIRPVWEAVERDAGVEALLVAPELLTSDPARLMVRRAEEDGLRVVPLGASAFESFSTRDNPSGMAAIVRSRTSPLSTLQVSSDSIVVALHEVSNPGNVGAIIRTVEAVGGSAVIVIGDATDVYHPDAVKASLGALFTIDICLERSLEDVFAWCDAHVVERIMTSAHAADEHWSLTYRLPMCMFFGNEGRGLPDAAMTGDHQAARIPMQGSVSSLNLAVAVGVLLYEVRRQHPASGRRSADTHRK